MLRAGRSRRCGSQKSEDRRAEKSKAASLSWGKAAGTFATNRDAPAVFVLLYCTTVYSGAGLEAYVGSGTVIHILINSEYAF